MDYRSAVLTAVSGLLLAGCATSRSAPDTIVARASLIGTDGAARGTASLREVGGRLMISVNATQLAPGAHGIHLHKVGQCIAPSFASAAGHLNPEGKLHGAFNPLGSHLGDLPNILIGADGQGSLEVTLAGSAAADLPAVLDSDGTAIMIHAGTDDYVTDPSGNSGDRIACGVLMPVS